MASNLRPTSVRDSQAKKRERVSVLERENLRLSTLLYGDGKKVGAARYFKVRGREELLN